MNPRFPANRPAPVSSCDCRDCRDACTNAPGWFLPEQVPKLAAHLGLTVAECFRKYLSVGVTYMPDGSERHGVLPHKLRDRKKPGTVWTLAEIATPGRCVFFDRGKCTIYPVRPDECARMIHGREKEAVALRHTIVRRWTQKALAPFAEFVGRKLNGG
jgi:Fe-S-cluster containining protein